VPVETASVEDVTQPTSVIEADVPIEVVETPTDVDLEKIDLSKPESDSPVLALAKPKKNAAGSLAQHKLRLPTESEIHAAVEGTPTEPVPLRTPAREDE